ncbi:MAG: hypothetical protein OEZ06_31260 [Myxococcales bacterium]|nr:hypothetical protein [Myxococcales bacterium]
MSSNLQAVDRTRLTTWLRLVSYFILVILAFELIVAYRFALRPGQPAANIDAITRYFEYGRSVEGKLVRMVAPTDEATQPIARAGWVSPLPPPEPPLESGEVRVAIYGMSFAKHIAQELSAIDPTFVCEMFGGPGAPANLTFAAFQADRRRTHARVVVWAVLASSVRRMGSLSIQTAGFEQPVPMTFPRFDVVEGRLTRIDPVISSLAELRAALAAGSFDDPVWIQWRQQLEEHDDMYDALLFRHNVFDGLATVRLMRRAWWGRHISRFTTTVYDPVDGFGGLPARTLPVLAEHFLEQAQQDGRIPVVMLIHDQGFGTHLFRLMRPILDRKRIPYLSTHETVPPDNPHLFLSDGHIAQESNHEVAVAFRSLLLQELRRGHHR